MSKNDKQKTVYIVKIKENIDFGQRIELINHKLSEIDQKTNKNHLIMIYQGEIFKYLRSDNRFGLCISLENSFKERNDVLICPLFSSLSRADQINGLNLGMIPELSIDCDFVAGIHKICFIDKEKLFIGKKDERPYSLCILTKDYIINILNYYKIIIERILLKDVKMKTVYTC